MSEDSEIYEQLVGELLDAIDAGKLTEEGIGQFQYRHMIALCAVTLKLQNGRDMYLKLRDMIQKTAVSRLKKQPVIKVGFMIHDSTVWIGDRLYQLLEESERFEPYIYCLRRIIQADVLADEYQRLVDYFKNKGLRTVDAGANGGEDAPVPDVCIWLTPWVYDFDKPFKMKELPLSTLYTYIPYGYDNVETKDGSYKGCYYDMGLHNVCWKHFANDKVTVDEAPKHSYANTNSVYTGYPKMDNFFSTKRHERMDGKKLVIYAPHHTVLDDDLLHFSTFEYNNRFMLELANKYSDRVAWVFKPHPLLKVKAEAKGIFRNAQEWNAYLDEWRSIPDAEVVEEGMYTQLFIDSDAMIFDSASFMSEYYFADRPALFLTRPGQYFTALGAGAKNAHYNADGKDFKAIEDFLRDVVLGGNDTKKEERHRFFEENLDYRQNGCLAADNIFNELSRELL